MGGVRGLWGSLIKRLEFFLSEISLWFLSADGFPYYFIPCFMDLGFKTCVILQTDTF